MEWVVLYYDYKKSYVLVFKTENQPRNNQGKINTLRKHYCPSSAMANIGKLKILCPSGRTGSSPVSGTTFPKCESKKFDKP